MKVFASIAAAVGAFVAATASMGCVLLILDEPEMPESLL
jgi:cyclic lactone autoinducer peptide